MKKLAKYFLDNITTLMSLLLSKFFRVIIPALLPTSLQSKLLSDRAQVPRIKKELLHEKKACPLDFVVKETDRYEAVTFIILSYPII